MIKKIILISLFVIFAGVLIVGAVNRTNAKTKNEGRVALENPGPNNIEQQNSASSQGKNIQLCDQQGIRQGQGIGNGGVPQGRQNLESNDPPVNSQGQGNGCSTANQGTAADQGRGLGQNRAVDSVPNTNLIHESILIEGIVVQVPSAGVDMILETADGSVLIGTGPGYLDEQGFILSAGDVIQVIGFWENEEFKAEVITHLANDRSITLRDEFGRPMWSGAVRGGKGLGNQGRGGAGRNGNITGDS